MKKIYVTLYTKEEGKLEFTQEEWLNFNTHSVTFHREDGPAVIMNNGYQSYYVNNNLHREDGPAVIYGDGRKEYWVNSACHREDGPAVIYGNGKYSYRLNGVYYSKEEYYKKLEEIDNLPISLKLTHEEEWVRERAQK